MSTVFNQLQRLKHLWWRIAGGVTLVLAISLYRQEGGTWLVFALLLLFPDLGALGYLVSARAGARGYNSLHNYPLPLALLAAGMGVGNPPVVALAAIWLAHIGMDRLLGYKLKAVPLVAAASPTQPGADHSGPLAG